MLYVIESKDCMILLKGVEYVYFMYILVEVGFDLNLFLKWELKIIERKVKDERGYKEIYNKLSLFKLRYGNNKWFKV